MGIVSTSLVMIAGASAFLGIARLFFWLTEPRRYDYLIFSIVCLSLSAYAFFEIELAHSTTPAEYIWALRWGHLFAATVLVGVAAFVWRNLNGRASLFGLVFGLRFLAIILNFFVFPSGINFSEVTAIGRMSFLGETLSYPIGVQNPWMILSQAAHVILVIMCIDASIRTWRKGKRPAALIFGTTTVLFAISSLGLAIAVLWGFARLPLLATPSILFLIAGMVVELYSRVLESVNLADRLTEKERELNERIEQLNLSVSAASVGLWRRDMETGKFWASDTLKQMYGFPPNEDLSVDELNDRIHPADRERVHAARRLAEVSGGEYQIEYRIVLPDGSTRWIFTRGRADDDGIRPRMKRGAAVDVTQRRFAENTVHELSGKLINAQEEERGRIARELHDDLSQRVALTSILLEEVRGADDASRFVKSKLGDIIAQILTLATDMHRLSHELHPAKIGQLGLELALRSYCRDLQAAYPIKIHFDAVGLPVHLPNDVSLCFYRVAQESLQNVVRHSGAKSANVSIALDTRALKMTITDDGCGFDPSEVQKKDSLGLISIDERLRSVSGEARIHSTPGSGTTIEAIVSLNSNTAEGRSFKQQSGAATHH